AFHFIVATWWVGTIAGAVLVWRRGGRSFDVLFGAIAGTSAGAAVAATIACVMPLLDWPLPWTLFRALNSDDVTKSAWLWSPVWILVTLLWWLVLGGVIGFLLSLAGRRGRQLIGYAARPIAWLLGLVGLKGAAGYVTM